MSNQIDIVLNETAFFNQTYADVNFCQLPENAIRKFILQKSIYNQLAKLIDSGLSLTSASKKLSYSVNLSPRHLQRFYNNVLDTNFHWSSFIDKRYLSEFWKAEKEETLPKAFITYWQELCLKNQRCNQGAWQKLLLNLQAWKDGTGEKIPGYNQPPPNDTLYNFPKGWSYRNLLRLQPTKFELEACRQGRDKAMATLPSVRTSRAGTYFFQELQFDDMWHDFMINDFGNNPSAVRLLEFGCIDVNSGYVLPPLLKPRLKDATDGKMKNLNEKDFRFYLAVVLTQIGYNPKGTILTVEHGTAAISAELENKLDLFSNSAIKIRRSGIVNKGAYIGAFDGRGKGNPRVKALKEGIGKLLHNSLADIQGQIGINRENCPAELYGILKDNNKLLKIYNKLSPEKQKALKFGLLDFNTASELIYTVYETINKRTEHNIEGWEKCGYITTEVKFPNSENWINFESAINGLDENQAELFRAMAKSNNDMIRTRKLSPKEVFEMQKKALVKLPEYLTPQLVGTEYATKRSPRRMVFEFYDKEVKNELCRYEAKAISIKGEQINLYDNENYLTFINPFKPDVMFVLNEKGAYIGYCNQWTIPSRTNTQEVLKDFGRIRKEYNSQIERVNRFKGKENLERMQHNTKVLQGFNSVQEVSITTAVKERSEQDYYTDFSIDDILPSADQE